MADTYFSFLWMMAASMSVLQWALLLCRHVLLRLRRVILRQPNLASSSTQARHLGGDSKGSLRPSSSGRETSARTHAVDPIKESSSSASRIKRRVVDLQQITEGCTLEEGRYVAPTNKNLSSLNDSRTSPSAYSLSSNPPGLPHYPNPPQPISIIRYIC